MTILDTEKDFQSTPDERIKQASEILNLCKLELKSLVKDGPEALEKSFNDAFILKIMRIDNYWVKTLDLNQFCLMKVPL